MDRVLAEFQLEDGGTVLFEVPEPASDGGSALEPVSVGGQALYRATKSFDQAIAQVRPVVSSIATQFKQGLTAPADEVQIKFGLNLSVDAGAVFSSVGGQVNFEVTLKWTGDDAKAS